MNDILSAVEYARASAPLDASRVYLVGGSGGGHAALLMAGRAPHVWAGVSAWVPISDVEAWHRQSQARGTVYARMIEQCCGGPPLGGSPAQAECRRRSPLTYLAAARGLPLDINAGITDGHTGSVPVGQSLWAFNALARPEDRLTDEQIDFFETRQAVPPGLEFAGSDPAYGAKRVLFRRQSLAARITIFQGGHELLEEAAFDWLERCPPRAAR